MSRSIASLVVLAACAAGLALAAAPNRSDGATPAEDKDCFHQLVHGRGSEIACEFPVRMTEEELAAVRKATRDLLQDATCTMTIRIERSLVEEVTRNESHVFQAPPQPVACVVITRGGSHLIDFTFAPRVEVKNGEAVKASPVMADVKGVSSVLAWPVVTYVNRSGQIEEGMLKVVNAYLKRFGRAASAQK